jgi:hypothetical protein
LNQCTTSDEHFTDYLLVCPFISAFAIIILCGAVIAILLQEQHQIEEMVADIRQRVKNRPVIAGVFWVFTGSASSPAASPPIFSSIPFSIVEKQIQKNALSFCTL